LSGIGLGRSDLDQGIKRRRRERPRLNVVLSKAALAACLCLSEREPAAYLLYLGLLVAVDRVARNTAAATGFRDRDLTMVLHTIYSVLQL
jgi:hypothetical protein